MNTVFSILRIGLLLFLFASGILDLLAMPADDSSTWLFDLLSSKTLGAGAFWVFDSLYSRWKETDPLVSRYEAWNRRALRDQD